MNTETTTETTTENLPALDVPVITGCQAQGDLVVIPADWASVRGCTTDETSRRPLTVHEVVRGEMGRNAHTLAAEPGAATIADVTDPTGLALVAVTVDPGREAQLHHVEHGLNLIGPGAYIIRRQQESTAAGMRLVAD